MVEQKYTKHITLLAIKKTLGRTSLLLGGFALPP